MKIVRRAAGSAGLKVPALALVCAFAAVACGGNGAGDADGKPTIGIVALNLSNPFFGTLEKATENAAKEKGWKVMKAEAKTPGDSATQVTAIENMIANKVKAIVVTPASATALNGVLKRAEDQGILVLAVNAPLNPVSTADGTYATDNVAAGKLIGQWAKASAPADPRVAMLDFDLSDAPAADRHEGFLAGFGIAPSALAGSALTKGTEDTGQQEMENLLSAHSDINVVYTINEPTARGAHTAIKNKGLEGEVVLVSVDGACSGVQDVKDGVIGATAMQFPDKMGEKAVEAVAAFIADGTKPEGGVVDSGTELVTDHPVKGLASQTSEWGLEHCWGPK
ncbi:substrate-binding domain-containing protein [Streptomyces sp. NBC_01754]|uniref:substrate-binding domain-containing protein n=1 Tax=Streptomyces sp. NBC_01754 TaxID=2975930 RepID=UPI002DD7C32D|nr:substrate-binding domain-containing protein [Streptomyces sp. NBC_01754]WSC94031.1 substrate-binding domain-containing protein [Streptomyces sp. NBC_01754]